MLQYADGAAVIRRLTKKQVDGILPDDHLFSLEVSCYILLEFQNNVTLYAMCKDISYEFYCYTSSIYTVLMNLAVICLSIY